MAGAGRIALYGATGYTGRLVAAELRRRGLDFLVAGRNAERVREVVRDLGGDVPCRVAALEDRDALRHAVGDCAVVINCAGPFTRYGEPVVRAAVETGTHYVDTTGEQGFMQDVAERYDAPARAAEVAVMPACGFDYVPGDLICRLAAGGHEPLRELVLAYFVADFGATRGTLHSALEVLRGNALEYRDGGWRPAGTGPLRASFTFPGDIGRQAMLPYACGEVVTVPRHTRVGTIRSLISAADFAPHAALAPAMPFALVGLGAALRTPLKAGVDMLIQRLPEGPEREDRIRARWTIVAVAEGEDGSTTRGIVRGSDPYGLTAVTAVHAATLLAGGDCEATGFQSPASAFDPAAFLGHLGEHGVSHELDPPATAAAA